LSSNFFLFPRKENMFVSQSQDDTWDYKSPKNPFEKLHNIFPKLREFFIYKQVKIKSVVNGFIQMAVNILVNY
jgi:hypothetical protein